MNVQVFGKPLERLIDTVSKGIGIRYKPKAIRNEADAEAYKIEVIAGAKAKASLIKADADNEIADRARQRLYVQEMSRQRNLESIIEKSEEYLTEETSEKEVDEDWRTRFFNKAQDVSSEEMQEIWAKILASEVNKPGKFSVRTLDILSNLSKHEAEIFTKLAKVSLLHDSKVDRFAIRFRNENGLQPYYQLEYADVLNLADIGLINSKMDLFCKLYSDNNNESVKAHLDYGEYIYCINGKKSIHTISLPAYKFTVAGAELAGLIDKNSFSLIDEVLKISINNEEANVIRYDNLQDKVQDKYTIIS